MNITFINFFKHQTMHKVQDANNPKCDTPLSESCRNVTEDIVTDF